MEKIIKSAMLLVCSMFIFAACEDERDVKPTIQVPESFVLNTPAYASTAVDLATTSSIEFTMKQPDFGFPVATTYQLQVSKDGNFTKDLADVAEGEETTANFTTLPDIFTEPKCSMPGNRLSNAINLMNGWTAENLPEEAIVYVRALATTAAYANPTANPEINANATVYSNVVTIKVKPTMDAAPSFDEWIYAPGNGQDWKPESAAALRSESGDGIYTGYVYLDGGFKFTKGRDWSSGEYNRTVFETVPSFIDIVSDEKDNNLICNEAGVYYMTVDIPNKTITAEKIDNFNLVGGYQNWDPADPTQTMTWDVNEMCYVKTGAEATGEWKFAANDGWVLNLGGDGLENLWQDGPNITVDAAGKTVKLYPLRNTSENIYCTVE